MNPQPTLTALGLSMTLLLAACGDNPQELPAPQPQASTGGVPASALGSSTAFSQFAASLARTESGAPLEINGVVAPTSETADPIPVL